MMHRTTLSRWPRRGGQAVLALAALALCGLAASSVHRLRMGADLAAQAQPRVAHPVSPQRRLLVVGDSTAVGTGASSPATSVPGLMAAAHPDWWIDNLAVNGARFRDVVQQLAGAAGTYDLVLILAGGNDVIRLTGRDALQQAVAQAVSLAQARGRTVVLMPCGDVGHAGFFFPPVSWLMSQRSAMLHEVVAGVAASTGSRYVRLLQGAASDPFALDPDRMNAADGLHPSDLGYQHWYATLQAQGGLAP